MNNPTRFFGWVTKLALSAFLAATFTGDAFAATAPRDPLNGRQSYSGSNMSCLVANDFYVVHFTAMQQGRAQGESSDFVKYCQEIPNPGKTFLTIDLLDRDVRSTPISLRVVEEQISDDGEPPRVLGTLTELAPKIYKNGTADTHVVISKPGHYALLATIGDEAQGLSEDDHLRIPFSVGLPPPTQYGKLFGKFAGGLALLFFAAMGVIGYRTYRAYCPKCEPTDEGLAQPRTKAI